MKIDGKVYCFFEQSGTFKNEFCKLGIPAEDYDIQNEFEQTDHVCDLFEQIEWAWAEHPSIFDDITADDLILAFFPCINFCDAKTMMFRGVSIYQKKWSLEKIMHTNIQFSRERQKYYELLMKLVCVCTKATAFDYRKSVEHQPGYVPAKQLPRSDIYRQEPGTTRRLLRETNCVLVFQLRTYYRRELPTKSQSKDRLPGTRSQIADRRM